MQILKTNLKQIFEGGLYPEDSEDAPICVIVTKRQAIDCKFKKEGDAKIKLGSVSLLIN